jgi:hypothetical protein
MRWNAVVLALLSAAWDWGNGRVTTNTLSLEGIRYGAMLEAAEHLMRDRAE